MRRTRRTSRDMIVRIAHFRVARTVDRGFFLRFSFASCTNDALEIVSFECTRKTKVRKKGEKRKKIRAKNSGLRLEKVLEKVTRREARRRANARKKGNEGSATCIELRSDLFGAFFRRFCAIARCRARWTVIVFFFFSKRRNKECEKIIVARDGKRANVSRDLRFCDAR